MNTYRPAQEQDEYTHPPTGESHFNESMYFNFFNHDRAQPSGGFVRIGNRPNEGKAEVTLLYYLADGGVLFNFQRPQIKNNLAFDAANMHFEVIRPFRELAVRYQGPAFHLLEPLALANPKEALSQARAVTVELELAVEGLSEVYGGVSDQDSLGSEEVSFAKAHYEQHINSKGFLTADGRRFEIDGLGLRDHSWGPRYWQAPKYYRWLTVQFDRGHGLMLTVFASPSGKTAMSGFLHRSGRNTLIHEVEIETSYAESGPYQKEIRARFTTEKGEKLSLNGRVLSLVPLRNRRKDQTTRICEGFTRYELDGKVGYGISEYLDQE
ncbi:MAG: hypothetical protein AB1640_11960 [bacterium]